MGPTRSVPRTGRRSGLGTTIPVLTAAIALPALRASAQTEDSVCAKDRKLLVTPFAAPGFGREFLASGNRFIPSVYFNFTEAF